MFRRDTVQAVMPADAVYMDVMIHARSRGMDIDVMAQGLVPIVLELFVVIVHTVQPVEMRMDALQM